MLKIQIQIHKVYLNEIKYLSKDNDKILLIFEII